LEEYIKLLDLPDEFDFAILKKAYRKKVKMYHPDKAVDEAQRIGFEAAMKKLNEANERLKEYLEQHNGKYIKPVEEENLTEDYSAVDNDNESSPEEEANEECEEETENSGNSENSNTWTPAPEQVENSRNFIAWANSKSNNPFIAFAKWYCRILIWFMITGAKAGGWVERKIKHQ